MGGIMLSTSSSTHVKGEEAVFAEDNKALVRRFVDEVQSGGNIDLIDEICSPEFVNHSAPPRVPPNCEEIKIVMAMFREAFPDSYFTVEDMIAEGDKVVTRKTFHGTHEGEFIGIPPSGKTVTIELIDIVRISEGMVVEHWFIGDNLGMMRQLGAIPLPGESV
jgi:predicted SnoaL-like aldol condensation-catalyzing enzyme